MPLKHVTETFLLFLLGAVIAVTGLLTASLPPLPRGGIAWATLLLLAFLYPLLLTPLFRSRRADNVFRLLHWAPAVLLLLWFALQVLAWAVPVASGAVHAYTWGWTLPGVLVAFGLLTWFTLTVIRRREARVALLSLAFVPFLAGAIASEWGGHWEQTLGSLLWEGELWRGSGSMIARLTETPESEKNLMPSSDPSEEAWREQLRRSESRSSGEASSPPADGVLTGELQGGGSSSAPSLGQASSRPGLLPDAGGEMEVLLLTFIALYSAVLHDRARRRV